MRLWLLRQQRILTSPFFGLWHKFLKFTSSLLSAFSLVGCSHPGPGQGSRQLSQAAVLAPCPLPRSQQARSPRASTYLLLPLTPSNIPLFLKHRNNKASPTCRAMTRRKDRFPPATGTKGSLWMYPKHRWPHTGPAPGHRSSTHFRRDLGFCRRLLLRTHFYCAEGGTVRKSPSSPSTTSLFSGWKANKGLTGLHYILSYDSGIAEKETWAVFYSSSSLL